MSPWIETFYFQSPVWIQNILVSAYGFKLRKERYSAEAENYLAYLLKTEQFDKERMHIEQTERFVKLAKDAITCVPFYRDWAKSEGFQVRDIQTLEALNYFPIIEKSTLRENSKLFIDERVLKTGQFFSLNTSGSSGSPITIYGDVASRTEHYAFWSRLRSWFGVTPLGRRATFFGRIIMRPEIKSPPFWRYDRFQHNLLMSSYHLTDDNIHYYYQKLLSYQPEEIIAYPSSLYPIAKYIQQNGLVALKPKVVFTTAETLLNHQREQIEASFDCPVIDQYGCTEMVLFSSQCECGGFHLHPEHGIMELLNSDNSPTPIGDIGEAVCTGLINRAMPLIRYRLGDRLSLAKGSCQCGRAFPLLQQLEGRVDDILLTPDNRPLGRMDPIFKGLKGIYETQIIQSKKNQLEFNLVIDKQYDQCSEDKLKYEILKRTGSEMKLVFSYMKSIPKDKNGKFKSVINRI